MAPSPLGLPISVSRRTCDNSPREGGKPEALEHWFVGQREQAPRGRDGACRAVQRDVFALECGRQSGIAQPYLGEGHEIGGYDDVDLAARSFEANLDVVGPKHQPPVARAATGFGDAAEVEPDDEALPVSPRDRSAGAFPTR